MRRHGRLLSGEEVVRQDCAVVMDNPQGHTPIVILVTDAQASTRVAQLLSNQNVPVLILIGFALDDLAAWSQLARDGGGNHACLFWLPRRRRRDRRAPSTAVSARAGVARSRSRSGLVSPCSNHETAPSPRAVVGTARVYSRRTRGATRLWTTRDRQSATASSCHTCVVVQECRSREFCSFTSCNVYLKDESVLDGSTRRHASGNRQPNRHVIAQAVVRA